jgi:hypothetical protein
MSFRDEKECSLRRRAAPKQTRENNFSSPRASRLGSEHSEKLLSVPQEEPAASHSSSSLVTPRLRQKVFIFVLNEFGKLRPRGKLMPSDSTHKIHERRHRRPGPWWLA